MRGIYLTTACLAVVVAVGIIPASAIDGGSSDIGIGALTSSILNLRSNAINSQAVPKDRNSNSFSPTTPPVLRLAQVGNPVSTGNPSLAPLKWVGMLINRASTAKNPNTQFQCTGQFVKPNIVLTAAHCIKDLTTDPNGPGYDLTRQSFILQYQNGEGSQTFSTKCALTSPGWKFPPNYPSLTTAQQDAEIRKAGQHDFAMILVDGTSATGVMPYQLDWKGKWGAASRVGYPIDILSGQIIQHSRGVVFFVDAIPMFPGESLPNLVAHWQPLLGLTSGTSGGAWIANFSTMDTPGNNILITVTSFQNITFPGVEFGPYLTAAEFNPLLAKVQNGCK